MTAFLPLAVYMAFMSLEQEHFRKLQRKVKSGAIFEQVIKLLNKKMTEEL